MITARIAVVLCVLALPACANLNPLAGTELTEGFPERVTEVNNAYRAERNAQILINILRARDRQDTKYTQLSDLKLTPVAEDTTTYQALEIGIGDNVPDPWAKLGAERSLKNASNLELTVSPNALDSQSNSTYRSPVSPEQFQFLIEKGWASDLVAKIVVDRVTPLVAAPADPNHPNRQIVDRILERGLRPFRVFTGNGELNHCFDLSKCGLVEEKADPPAAGKPAAEKKEEEKEKEVGKLVFDVTESVHGASLPLDQRAEIRSLPMKPNIDGRFLYCRQEATAAATIMHRPGERAAPKPAPYDIYRCSGQPLSAAVCAKLDKDGECKVSQALPLSLFFVSKNGIYTLDLNSVDDAIFSLGEALRGYDVDPAERHGGCEPGMAQCANAGIAFSSREVGLKEAKLLPLFSLATAESLGDRKDCVKRFSAAVTYADGKTYYAGPPQSFTPDMDPAQKREGCYFDDRSGTVLSMIAQLIELKQVPIALTPTSLILRD